MEERDTRIVGNSFDKYSSLAGFPETTLECAKRLDKQWKWWSTPKYSPVSDITGPSAGRVFLSSFPHVVQDGVGHMSEIISWELKAARVLRARYTHRDAYYSSLGTSVDDFFRWGTQAEGRSVLLSKICNKTEFVIDACRGNRTRCAGLKSSARPFVKLVDVPVAMIHCALRSSSPKQLSRCKLDTFLERHDGEGIVFQLDTDTCYWRNSARWEFPELVGLADSYWSRKHDTFRMDHWRLHIAVHIRRGDILFSNSSTNGRFRLYSDEAIANMIYATISAVEAAESRLKPGYEVHIFSQGAKRKGSNVQGHHNIKLYPGGYVDEFGVEQAEDYWQKRLEKLLPMEIGRRLMVTMRISADTLKSISTMASADIFIATRSTLGNSLVRGIGRGVQIQGIPQGPEFVNGVSYPIALWNKAGDAFRKEFTIVWRRYRAVFGLCSRY
jgi:hypothetical protein